AISLDYLFIFLSVSGCSAEFREPRVIELWEAAKRANLSKDELESLKEELRHFETKVEKHSHYQEQLELSHQKLRHVESLGDKEHIKRNQEKYNTLAEKTREMGYKRGLEGRSCSGELLWSAFELGVTESDRWPSPPAFQLSQPVLSALNVLRPHSLSRFHGSDVELCMGWAHELSCAGSAPNTADLKS
ncbi:hypothetical protein XENOCAPTIV_006711, partial [Xenoophorus captivus]